MQKFLRSYGLASKQLEGISNEGFFRFFSVSSTLQQDRAPVQSLHYTKDQHFHPESQIQNEHDKDKQHISNGQYDGGNNQFKESQQQGGMSNKAYIKLQEKDTQQYEEEIKRSGPQKKYAPDESDLAVFDPVSGVHVLRWWKEQVDKHGRPKNDFDTVWKQIYENRKKWDRNIDSKIGPDGKPTRVDRFDAWTMRLLGVPADQIPGYQAIVPNTAKFIIKRDEHGQMQAYKGDGVTIATDYRRNNRYSNYKSSHSHDRNPRHSQEEATLSRQEREDRDKNIRRTENFRSKISDDPDSHRSRDNTARKDSRNQKVSQNLEASQPGGDSQYAEASLRNEETSSQYQQAQQQNQPQFNRAARGVRQRQGQEGDSGQRVSRFQQQMQQSGKFTQDVLNRNQEYKANKAKEYKERLSAQQDEPTS